jgi:Mn2+/Fe2+ NRAMP family transporter
MSSFTTAEPAQDPRVGMADQIQAPPHSLLLAFRQVGPGLILAAAIVGTGELIATTHAGAKAGFVLLWLVIVSCFIKVFVQVELGRYAVSSGRTTFSGFRSLPGPGPLLVWWCALMLLVTQLQIGAMIAGIGQAAHMVLPGASTLLGGAIGLGDRPELLWGVLVTALTAAMLWTGSYRLVERTMTLFVAIFTLMTVLCVTLLPKEVAIQWDEIVSGLTFRLPRDRTVLLAALAMFGITGVGATELLSYPYWCMEKGYARSVGPRDATGSWADRARGWLRVMQLDAWVSMVIYTIATVAFFLLGAAVLHDQTEAVGLPDRVDQMINTLVRMYEPALGPTLAKWFLVSGAIAVLYSTLFAATAGTGRLLADFLRVCGYYPSDSEVYRKRWVRFFCVLLPIMGLLLYISLGNPVTMVTIGGLMQAITLPFIAAAAVFLRYRRTDPRLTGGIVWDVLLWLSMLGLVFAGGYLAADRLGLV